MFEETIYLQTQEPVSSIWKGIEKATPDPVFGLIHFYLADSNPRKVLLGVGAYRDDEGKPVILECVKKAEKILLEKEKEKEYAFPDGYPSFRQRAIELAYGKDHPALQEQRIACMQTVSGTGALKLGFQMLKEFYPKQLTKAYVCNPTWSLHHNIIKRAGFDVAYLRYYDPVTKGLDILGFLEDLESIDDEQILLIQVSSQNPSGVDPSQEQWQTIFDIVKRKRHFVFFDSAYQGFASDNMDDDNFSLRTLACQYYRVMLAQSFSKNFGLYGERTGSLSIICTDSQEKEIMQTRFKEMCLPEYSNPPIHGARIVDEILGSDELKREWKEEVKKMSQRLKNIRSLIVERLRQLGSEHDWSHIEKQIGMFAYTGLKPEMVEELKRVYSIYLPIDGRISLASVNQSNVEYFCQAVHDVSKDKCI